MFGWDHEDVTSGRVASAQSLSGTGALKILADFLAKFKKVPLYLSTPTWANHAAIFEFAGLEVNYYRYFHKETRGIDFDGMIEDLRAAPNGSIVVLHTCAHNPTGCDPSHE